MASPKISIPGLPRYSIWRNGSRLLSNRKHRRGIAKNHRLLWYESILKLELDLEFLPMPTLPLSLPLPAIVLMSEIFKLPNAYRRWSISPRPRYSLHHPLATLSPELPVEHSHLSSKAYRER